MKNLPGPYKYLQFGKRRADAKRLVGVLRLHNSPPIKILDIGTASGHFVKECLAIGHFCIGLDEEKTHPAITFARWCQGIDVVLSTIRPNVLLPKYINGFDLIVAWRSQFHFVEGRRWTHDEWAFFLDDILSHLRPAGIFVLKMAMAKGETHADASLIELFRSYGATGNSPYTFVNLSGKV